MKPKLVTCSSFLVLFFVITPAAMAAMDGESTSNPIWIMLSIASLLASAALCGLVFIRWRQARQMRELSNQVRKLPTMPRGDRCVSLDVDGELGDLAGAINAIVAEADRTGLELDAMESKLARMNRDIYELANADPLTGLANRRRFFEDLTQQLAQAGRYQNQLCLAVFDVDGFREINEDFGFMAGDKVLRDLARITLEALRDSDIVARLGNEEFALIMPETPHGGGVALCERLRRDFEISFVEHDGKEVCYRCSFGVTGYDPENDSPDTLLGRGYNALRLAKESGRNRVIAN